MGEMRRDRPFAYAHGRWIRRARRGILKFAWLC